MSEKKSMPNYQEWLDKGAWNLKESLLLLMGWNPKAEQQFSKEIERDLIGRIDFKPRPWSRPTLHSFMVYLHDEAHRCITGGKLKAAGEERGRSFPLFKPRIIVEWLCEITSIRPSPDLNAALFPQKEKERKTTASKIEHKKVFDALQKEYVRNDLRLGREDEEAEMARLLHPKGFSRKYFRDLRKELNLSPGAPRKKTGK